MSGVNYTITVDDMAARKRLKEIRERGENLKPLMEEIGSIVVASTIRRFETGTDPDGRPWKPSQRALKTGGQTLVDTARLMGSIVYRATSSLVEIGSNVIYAAIHQLSGHAGRGGSAFIPARAYLGLDDGDRSEIEDAAIHHIRGLN